MKKSYLVKWLIDSICRDGDGEMEYIDVSIYDDYYYTISMRVKDEEHEEDKGNTID